VAKVCETCKYKAVPPSELEDLIKLMSRYFPKVFYCSKQQVVKVYDPSSPAKTFSCDFYESGE